jgi:hypothetical protein
LFSNNIKLFSSKKAHLNLGFFFTIFFISYLQANQDFHISDSKIIKLSNKISWHGILDFNEGSLESKNQLEYLSDIQNFNPKKELRLSIDKYLEFLKGKNEFFCKYPSRAIFISENIQEIPEIDLSNCVEYNAWKENGSIKSISFMYVTGYLKNPASFFGHTLLKFNRDSQINGQSLLERSLNYGAETNDDAALPYVIKGLIGKYKASLQDETFFRLSAQYQEFQMRDIYEYKLNLSSYQKNIILAYTYEMKAKSYNYYFLGDNCAYRINRILGVALEGEPMPKTPWKAPIDLLIKIQDSELVSEIIYHPSQTTRAISSIEKLDKAEKDTLYKIFNNNIAKINNIDDLDSLDLRLAAIDYLNYKKLKAFKSDNENELEQIDSIRKNILLKIDSDNKNQQRVIKPKAYPHEISRPTLIRYKLHKNDGGKNAHTFMLRGANFEILDQDKSKMGNSEFIFLSPQISFYEDNLFIDEITLFKVTSLNDFKTLLPNELNYSWGIDVSRRNISSICYPCNVSSVSGIIGKSFYINENLSFYSLLEPSIHQSRKNSGNKSISFSSGMIISIDKLKINFNLDKLEFEKNNIFDEMVRKIEVKINLSKNFDFSIYIKNGSKTNNLGVNLNRYF